MRLAAAFGVILFIAAKVAGGNSEATELTLRSNTRLVQVSVIASDRQGHPIRGLKRSDFRLFDDKKPREIRVFSVDRVEPAAVEVTPSDAGNTTFSNSADERSIAAGITVIVLVSLNTKWGDQSQAARQVLKFLKQVQPGDRVAIYSLEPGGFRVLHEFTRDASDLVERLKNWKGDVAPPGHGQPGPSFGGELAAVLQGRDSTHQWSQFAGDFEFHNTASTLRGLEAVARRLEGIPGRKNVIWISDGFPELEWGNLAITGAPGLVHDFRGPEMVPTGMARGSGGEPHDAFGDTESYRNQFVSAMEYVSQANVAIYPVEARGLLTDIPEGDPRANAQYFAHPRQNAAQATMLEVAQKTGGRAFVNSNDIPNAIRESIGDSRFLYTLGFYPDAGHADGKFHEISIKVPGRGDVTLRYRSGYVNEPFSPTDLGRRARDLDQAFWSPLDANAIPLTGKVERTGAERARIDVSISLRSLDLLPEDGKRKGEADVLILQRNDIGNVFERVNETVQMDFRDGTYEKLLASGVPYHREIELNPQATMIRVVVRDSATGNLGSLSIPTKALASQDPRLEKPVIRKSDRLVQVSVVAHDNAGRPVSDLTRADFTLTENGQPQRISSFSVSSPGDKLMFGGGSGTPSPLTITNRAVQASGKPIPITVILFDALNIGSAADFLSARKELVEFLKTVQPGGTVAVYSLNGPMIRVISDFTDDPGAGGGFQNLSKYLTEGSRAEESARKGVRTTWTLDSLEAIAHHLSGIPGRKNLVWISGAFPIGSVEGTPSRETRIAELFADAQVAIYPVAPASADDALVDKMEALAKDTGGLAFYRDGSLSDKLRRAIYDARATYTLGFYPSQAAWYGNYHEIQVNVDRADVEVRARSGYLAAAQGHESAAERESYLLFAAASPVEEAAISVKVSVQGNPMPRWGQEVAVRIDAHDVRFERVGDYMRADVEVAFVQQARNGRIVRSERKTLDLMFLPEPYQDALEQGIFFTQPVTVEPQTARVRVVVLDASNGAMGSVSIPAGVLEKRGHS